MSAVPGAFAKSIKCLCCNNPWNQSNNEDNSITIHKDLLVCNPCLSDNKGYDGKLLVMHMRI